MEFDTSLDDIPDDWFVPVYTCKTRREHDLECLVALDRERVRVSQAVRLERMRRNWEYPTLHCEFPALEVKLAGIYVVVANELHSAVHPRTRHEISVKVDGLFETLCNWLTDDMSRRRNVLRRILDTTDYDYGPGDDELFVEFESEIETFRNESLRIVHRVELKQRVFLGWVLYTNELVYAPDGRMGQSLIQLYKGGLTTTTAAARLALESV